MAYVLAGDMARTESLAARIARLPWLIQSAIEQGTSPEDEAWRVIHGLADIEESVGRLYNDILARLLETEYDDPASEAALVTDLLQDVREEYRHILYHIRDATPFGLS